LDLLSIIDGEDEKVMYKKFVLMAFILLSLSAMLGTQFITPVVADLASLIPSARPLSSLYINGQKQIELSFHEPKVVKLGEYDLLKMEDCSYVSTSGHPQLPIKSVVVRLPLRSDLTGCDVNVESETLNGSYYIAPALRPTPAASEHSNMTTEPDPSIYNSEKLYPERWFDYRVGNGIDPETQNRITYLVIYFYPLRYIPAQRKVIFSRSATITVLYKVPVEYAAFTPKELDNLIITSPLLEPEALRLAQWKNFTGIKSRVLTTNWIYDHYDGVDYPEKIRNCIKDFVSRFQIMFVTIFGDTDQVPVRYAYVPDEYETLVPTDLYYADLDYSWDDNGDGLYADISCDVIDGIPDVYVGRIPPSFIEYAEAAVTKIIGYSTTDFSENWFDRALFVTGTPDDFGIGFVYLKDYVEGLTTKNVTKYNEPSPDTLKSEINKGQAFVNFAGHGDPGSWLLYWWLGIFPVTFTSSDAFGLTNGLKLPVVTAMACSTARFDDQDCIGEHFVLNPEGGSIAYFGSSRIAWGYADEGIVDGLMGEMDWRIYQAFSEGFSKLGEIWDVSITRYIQSHGLSWIYDEKTVMEFVLLGDPTLDVGVQYACVHLESREDTGATTNQGFIIFGGIPYSLPTSICKEAGSYQATYNPASGYRFDHWETSGGVSVTDPNAQTTTVTVSGNGTLRAIYTAALSNTMHVGGIDMSKQTIGRGWLSLTRAVAVVTILDAEGYPVEGAKVYGHWSGLASGKVYGVTGSNGQVTFKSRFVRSASGTFTFTVDNVIKDGWTYDSSANKETSDSITVP
jgi:hypothetical protein